jgi:SWI/SNF-related matrix-associated actin-dependent regulator of chromatin subfamily A3
MKDPAGRQCTCGNLLHLPTDAIEIIPPNEAAEDALAAADDPPKRAARKKYIRLPGEKPSLSTKMQYLHDELIKYSKQNPHSANYDVFEIDDAVETSIDGSALLTKSVVL